MLKPFFSRFWEAWFSDEIPGAKYTVAAILRQSKYIEVSRAAAVINALPKPVDLAVVGVCRLWQTPYLGSKWLIEGLEVVPKARRRGLGRRLVRRCMEYAQTHDIARLYAHVHDDNLGSRNLFRGLGFREQPHGYLNTYGHWRDNGSEFMLDLQSGNIV